jgi:hypothetical protein
MASPISQVANTRNFLVMIFENNSTTHHGDTEARRRASDGKA